MTSSLAAEAYENLVLELQDEPGVRLDVDGLLVNGTIFAFLSGDELVVDLPASRASDLVEREQGTRFRLDGVKSRDLVKVRDRSLWSELAREAHEYVGEPPVGGQS
ncbi:MAG: hypothetical protein QOH69_3189 [Actinomycetota bacterium]|jgi:hypothetical protein|nr:hypothetical protein [Actinomycetota bacterium]MDQ1551081.1 hypothetical protein [Actinomycetota bacterium]